MAPQSRRGGVLLPSRRPGKQPREPEVNGVLAKLANSPIVSRGKQVVDETLHVSKKLLKSTGKAAWIAGTTFLILVVPLIIEMDREQQLADLELQQQTLLGPPPSPSPVVK